MSFNIPVPTPEALPFWQGAAEGKLRLSYCLDTNQYFFYPRRFSPFTGSRNVEWRDASGRGTLHSFIINYRPFPGRQTVSPIIALVKLAEGPVLTTNIVGVEPEPGKLEIDMPLMVDFHEVEGIHLPVFKPLEAGL